ncbi:MAG: Cna B-type domain-containing protein, partial [Clostridia bacterium]|nr:Cna B-type domain-containing protein [Clostridia bacterium]
MTQMMEMSKMRYRRAAFLLSLLLLLSIGLAAHAQTEVPLKNYAASVQAELKANAAGDALPPYVENGQKLFFDLQISNFNSQELVAYLKANPEADFTIPLDFTGHIEGKYPTKINPDDFDNVAYVNEEELFRWWIDESSDVIRIRFDEEWIENAGSNTVVENVTLGFDGTLGVADKGADGKIVFNAAGYSFPLQMKTGYTLNKTAGVPYYSTDASSYVTDYTVTLTLDQNMMLSGSGDMYIAALTLVDTVENGGALQGTIVGDVTVTAPDGETASAAVSNNGVVNTLTLSSPDQKLVKGTYTFTYKMKIDPEAAAAKLDGYTEKQKTNTVELKENAASLKTPLTAQTTIAWEDVTDNQFKIDKSAFTDKAPDYKGVYWDEDTEKYYIDFRVVVYVREPVTTFTVTDHSNYSLTFRNVPASPVLEGVDVSENYWNNDINNAALTPVAATITSGLNDSSEMVITVTAPEGQTLAPGAYHLRVPADVTGAVETTLKNSYPQSYSNTAYLTSVDGQPTTENKEFKQAIPNRTEPRKDGGYAVDSNTGELLFHNGKPVIRWDVWFGWDFYDKTTFVDTLSGMEMLINANYPFEIHSFTDQNHHKERLASISSLNDTDYLDFSTDGTGFTFSNEKLYTNADGSPVKLYKLVYFTTPLDADNELGYVNTDLENGYSITHTTLSGKGFGTGPITGDVEPDMTSQGRLYVKKKHVIERTDSLTQWLITCDNTTNKIPFALFNDLDIIDLVPQGQTPIGEVTVHYSDKWPIEVEMVCSNNQRVTLTEGTHYSIVKKLEGYDFGDNGEYGFAVDLDMDAVAAVLAAQNSAYFKTIEVKCYLNNETHPSGQNYRIKNDGWLDYTNQGVELVDGVNAYYDRGFATKSKGVVEYGDNYDPNAPRRYYVCNPDGSSSQQSFTGGYDDDPTTGDGQDEIVWRIFIGAREFGNDDEPIQVTVTDTFSDNQMFPTYEGKSVKDLFIIRAEKNQDYVILPDSVSVNGNSFTLTFTVPAKGWVENNKDKSKNLYIYYHTILKPEAMQEALDAAAKDASTIKIDYTNTATVGWNGESYTLPTSSGSMTMNGSMLDKASKFMQSAGNKVSYTIEMNPYKLDLTEGSDTIQLEDNMSEGKDVFAYIPSSFKVTNMDTGAQLSPASAASATTYVLKMADDGKSFTLDVPDNTHLKLTYQVKTTQPVGTKDVTLLNNASLAGRKPQQKSITFDVSSAYQSGSFSVRPDEAGIRLMKISSEGADSDSPTFLSGAEFTVTQLDASLQQVGTVQTMTTDANGLIAIKQKITDVVYLVIEETKAPSGYRLGAEAWKWCYALVPAGVPLSDEDMARLKETVKCEVTVIPAGSYVEETITNEPVTLMVRKVDQDGNLLEGAQFTLKKGNAAVNPDSTYKVTGELLFKNLTQGTYTLEETAAPEGYTVPEECPWSFTLDVNGAVKLDEEYDYLSISEDGLCLIVVNKPETASVTVIKSWNDMKNQDGKRKDVVANAILSKTVDGTTTDVESVAVGKEDNWSHKWENLPVYEDGNKITYSVREELVTANGYTSNTATAVPVENDGSVTIVNTHTPEKVNIGVRKTWTDKDNQDGLRTTFVRVALMANGQPVLSEVVLNKDNDWSYGWTGLAKYSNGVEIEYTVEETQVPEGYTANVTKTTVNTGYSFLVTNSHEPEKQDISVVKEWDDQSNREKKRPDSVSVQLYADGSVLGEPVTLNEANQWTHTWSGLDKYAAGAEIDYTVDETSVPAGYVTNVTGDAKDGFTVKNTYVFGVTAQIKASKTLMGRDLETNQFTFILKDASGSTVQEVGHDKDGNVLFDALVYEQADEYTYTVEEKNDGKAGYIYDKKVYEVTVKVTQNEDDHQLKAEVSYALAGEEVDAITFENAYKARGSVQFRGVKTLMDGEMEEGQFSFLLQDAEGKEIETVRNDANALFTFSEITYDETMLGDHTYTLIEVDEGRPGYVYDDIEYEIIVTVSDAGDGTLDVTYTANGDENGALLFENEYVAEEKVQFVGKKTLTGRDLEEGQFSFTLTGEDVNETVTNDKDGKFAFTEITYDETMLGDHTYTVTEVNDGKAGYTYDDTEYEIVVTVADNGDGTLSVTYTVNGEENGAITFENEYKASGSVEFGGTKTLTGRELEEGQFSFTLTGENVNETVTNDKDGNFTFTEITYDETMLGEHPYTVTE